MYAGSLKCQVDDGPCFATQPQPSNGPKVKKKAPKRRPKRKAPKKVEEAPKETPEETEGTTKERPKAPNKGLGLTAEDTKAADAQPAKEALRAPSELPKGLPLTASPTTAEAKPSEVSKPAAAAPEPQKAAQAAPAQGPPKVEASTAALAPKAARKLADASSTVTARIRGLEQRTPTPVLSFCLGWNLSMPFSGNVHHALLLVTWARTEGEWQHQGHKDGDEIRVS